MKRILRYLALASFLISGCESGKSKEFEIAGDQSMVIKEMIDAVNEKDAEKYVVGFDESVQVFVGSEIKVEGKNNLRKNRAKHFKNHPKVRSEIQHLVEIDNKVVMHDKVWLNDSNDFGQDIVEIFTFENGKVVRVDVIQPKNLFQN